MTGPLWSRWTPCEGWLDCLAILGLGAVCVLLGAVGALVALWAPSAAVH